MTSPRRAMLALLLASAALRIALVWSGGQFYWPDEHRYVEARNIVAEVLGGQYGAALARLDTAEHLFFRIIALVPAAIESLAGDDPRIPGILFCVFPVINIGLLFLVAGRMGASERESTIAALLLALSNAFFYYARHLLPYDAAMTFALAAMYFGLGREGRIRSSAACGALAACAFLTYAGYWTMGASAVLLHVVDAANVREGVRRAAWATLAGAATLGAVLAINAMAGGQLLAHFLAFAGTIDQGAFDEGWRLTFEYLWHAEHAGLLAWIAAAVYWVARLPRALESRRVKLALAGLLFIYACLAISSTVLHAFVVYGRLARQLVPFFCLLSAAALETMLAGPPGTRRFVRPILVLLAAQAAVNFWMAWRVTFPADFLREADAARLNEVPGARVVNTRHLWPLPEPFELPRGYAVLKEAPHPLQFLPYQYEGYDPAQRQALRTMDIRMLVIAPAR